MADCACIGTWYIGRKGYYVSNYVSNGDQLLGEIHAMCKEGAGQREALFSKVNEINTKVTVLETTSATKEDISDLRLKGCEFGQKIEQELSEHRDEPHCESPTASRSSTAKLVAACATFLLAVATLVTKLKGLWIILVLVMLTGCAHVSKVKDLFDRVPDFDDWRKKEKKEDAFTAPKRFKIKPAAMGCVSLQIKGMHNERERNGVGHEHIFLKLKGNGFKRAFLAVMSGGRNSIRLYTDFPDDTNAKSFRMANPDEFKEGWHTFSLIWGDGKLWGEFNGKQRGRSVRFPDSKPDEVVYGGDHDGRRSLKGIQWRNPDASAGFALRTASGYRTYADIQAEASEARTAYTTALRAAAGKDDPETAALLGDLRDAVIQKREDLKNAKSSARK